MKKLLLLGLTATIISSANATSNSNNEFDGEEGRSAGPSSTQMPEMPARFHKFLEEMLGRDSKSTSTSPSPEETFLRENAPKSVDDFFTETPGVKVKLTPKSPKRTLTQLNEKTVKLSKTSLGLTNGQTITFFKILKECGHDKCGGMPALQLICPSLNDEPDTRVTAFAQEALPIGSLRLKPNKGLEGIALKLIAVGLMSEQEFVTKTVRGAVLIQSKYIYTLPPLSALVMSPSVLAISAERKGKHVNIIELPADESDSTDDSDSDLRVQSEPEESTL